jgi:hypothetical protein
LTNYRWEDFPIPRKRQNEFIFWCLGPSVHGFRREGGIGWICTCKPEHLSFAAKTLNRAAKTLNRAAKDIETAS